MKFSYAILLALVLAGCKKINRIEFTGTTPGTKNGVFVVKDMTGKLVYGANIKDEKFDIKDVVDTPGYYQMDITEQDSKEERHDAFDVYLDGGKYIIETQPGKLYKYPKITSPSKIQNELSAYYTLADNMIADIHQQAIKLTNQLNDKKAKSLPKDEFMALVEKLRTAQTKEQELTPVVMAQFVNKYPQNTVTPHLMLRFDYKSNPIAYNNIFNKLSQAVQNSEEGKEIKRKLSRLVKLVPGETGPLIYGKTTDGLPFDPKTLNKKIILVDFWRAGNQVSRMYHEKMRTQVAFQVNNKRDFGIVSVSLDERADWWADAIKQDRMYWTQVSDLKGNDSPNILVWGISKVPTYYLLDGQWRILKRDIDFNDITFEVTKYLETHR